MKTLPLIAVTLSLCALATAPALAQQTSTDTTGTTATPQQPPAPTGSSTMSTTTTTTTTGTMGTTMPNKPMVTQSPDTGKPIYILPPNATGSDKYKASWLFYNLDDREVKRYQAQGFSDSTIKGAANLALRTGLDVDYVLERVRESGYSLTQLAAMYGVTTDNLNADLPGMGAQSYSIASADMYAPTPSYAMSTTSTMSTSTASSASMPTATAATQGDIMSVLSSDPRFSTLASAIRAAGLTSSLQGAGPFTLFAPTNDAFAKLPAGTLDDLLKPENRSKLSSILLYHVVSGKMSGSDVLAMSAPGTPRSLQGDTLTVTNVAPVKVNDANVTATDIQASNGVIHAIDTVLMPPSMATAPAAATTTPTPAPATPAPVPNTPAPTTNPTPESPTTPASPGTPTTPNTPTTPAP